MQERKPRLDTERAIKRYKAVHGEIYDYSNTTYNGNGKHILVVCRTHGEFSVQHNNHISGVGCGVCRPANAGRPKALRKVCETHGEYVASKGCSKCRFVEQRKAAFFDKAKEVHGDAYDYTFTEYKTTHENVDVLCKGCGGTFSVAPCNHIAKGVGCQVCHRGKGGFDKAKPGVLYLIMAGDIYKVGITNGEPTKRAKFISSKVGLEFSVIKTVTFQNGESCVEAERKLLTLIRSNPYVQPNIYFDGYKECFVATYVPDYVLEFMENAQT